MVFHFFVALKNPDSVQYIIGVHHITFPGNGGQVGIIAIKDLSVQVDHLVLVVAHVPVNVVVEFASAVPVLKRQFNAAVIDRTHILFGAGEISHLIGKVHRTENVGGALIVNVGGNVQPVIQQRGVHADIISRGGFPADTRI